MARLDPTASHRKGTGGGGRFKPTTVNSWVDRMGWRSRIEADRASSDPEQSGVSINEKVGKPFNPRCTKIEKITDQMTC